ncbi:MAG: glycosyltransferase [Paludibacteraceae bacterium]|nr:glycosyltransferase [Paludibacteraceae bacterium]
MIIPTYNHQDVIGETLNALTKQTYNNIEFVISDDCSNDNTWNVIQAYIPKLEKLGKVFAHKQDRNLGICENYNYLFSCVHGDIVVINEGDDVSMPDRIVKVVNYFFENPRLVLLQSSYILYKDDEYFEVSDKNLAGKYSITNYKYGKIPSFAGCAMGFRYELISNFPQFDNKTPWVDDALGRRALLLGEFMQVDDKLLLYRIWDKNTSSDGMGRGIKRLRFLQQDFKDIRYAYKNGIIQLSDFIRIRMVVLREMAITMLNTCVIYRKLRNLIKNKD